MGTSPPPSSAPAHRTTSGRAMKPSKLLPRGGRKRVPRPARIPRCPGGMRSPGMPVHLNTPSTGEQSRRPLLGRSNGAPPTHEGSCASHWRARASAATNAVPVVRSGRPNARTLSALSIAVSAITTSSRCTASWTMALRLSVLYDVAGRVRDEGAMSSAPWRSTPRRSVALALPAQSEVEAFHCDRKGHGEVDVAFRNMHSQSVADQCDPDQNQKRQRQHLDCRMTVDELADRLRREHHHADGDDDGQHHDRNDVDHANRRDNRVE